MLLTPRRQPRVVSKVPFKVLDAPELADDFYLNLVDWGSANVLGVGLGSSVYMWNAQTSKVNKLCTLEDDTVTSVSWLQKGTHIAIGTGKGLVQIWECREDEAFEDYDRAYAKGRFASLELSHTDLRIPRSVYSSP